MRYEVLNSDHIDSIYENWWSGIETDRDRGDDYYYFGLELFVEGGRFSKMFEYKMEVFGTGGIANTNELGDFALCKPWAVNANNSLEAQVAESFLLIVPIRVLKNMVAKSDFNEEIETSSIKKTRILKSEFMFIDTDYKHFGLLNVDAPPNVKMNDIRMQRIDNIETKKQEILDFYESNLAPIENHIKYFNSNFNLWYKFSYVDNNEIIGYFRLYQDKNVFFSGFNIEYIISKKFRQQELATRLCNIVRNYILKYSYAQTLMATVENDNTEVINVLTKSGYTITKNDFGDNDESNTFEYDLLTPYLEMFDKSFIKNDKKIKIYFEQQEFKKYFG